MRWRTPTIVLSGTTNYRIDSAQHIRIRITASAKRSRRYPKQNKQNKCRSPIIRAQKHETKTKLKSLNRNESYPPVAVYFMALTESLCHEIPSRTYPVCDDIHMSCLLRHIPQHVDRLEACPTNREP